MLGQFKNNINNNLSLFQQLFDENTLPLLLVDPEKFTIVQANIMAQEFLGLPSLELKNMPLAYLSDIPPKRFNAIVGDFLRKKYIGLELSIKTHKHGKRDVSVHYTLADIDDVNFFLLVLVDITDRNMAFKALRDSKEFLATEVKRQTADLVNINSSLVEQIQERKLAEEKLRQSEQMFMRLFQINASGMIIKSLPTNQVVDANRSFLKIFGLNKGEVIQKNIEALPIHNNIDQYKRVFDSLIKEGEVRSVPLTMVAAQGHVRFVLYSGQLIKHTKGDYVLETFQDITTIQIAQKKLTDSEQRYRGMFDNALVGFLRTEIETGIVLECNSQFAKMLGYTKPAEIIGRSLVKHYINESARNNFIKILKQRKSFVHENVILTKDKKRIWIVNYSRIYPVSGFLEGVWVDITDRKLMEDVLAYSENRFRSLIENSKDLIIIANSKGKGLYFSPSVTKELGYTIEPSEQINILDFIDPKDKLKVKKLLERKTRSRKKHQAGVKSMKGSYRVFEFTITNLTTDPSVGGIIINARDITDQIKAREEIDLALTREQEISRQKTQFISTVSHEFRTPLTNISLNLQLLEKYFADRHLEKADQGMIRMKNAVKRLTSLLNEVTLISKDQSGRLMFSPESIELRSLIDDLLEQQSYLFLPYVELIVGNFENIVVNADKNLLSHIIVNLVSNAVKYSPKKGQIIVSIDYHEGILELLVKDHGIGIPKDELDYLFDPYFRASNVKQIQGTGLGLSIVRKCIDLHNGTLDIKSDSNKGTEVRCRIPV